METITPLEWKNNHKRILLLLQDYIDKLIVIYKLQYLYKNNELWRYKLPTIVLTSISGFLSMTILSYFKERYNTHINIIIGSLNLIVSIITIIEQFKNVNNDLILDDKIYHQLVELSNDIEILLAMPPEGDGLSIIKEIYNRFKIILKDTKIINGKNPVRDIIHIDSRQDLTNITIP